MRIFVFIFLLGFVWIANAQNVTDAKGLKQGYWKKLDDKSRNETYKNYSIVFIKRSRKYPYGHFLARYKNRWMDPWINLPDKNIKAGFREILPNEATYLIYSAK